MKLINAREVWLRFTDEGSEGNWYDRWSGEPQEFLSIPWNLQSEPTGYKSENCSGIKNLNDNYRFAFDIDCNQRIGIVCQDIKYFFRMRGLCLGSIIDREYKLVEPLSGGRRMFYGPSGWSIEWQKDKSFWQLSNDRIPGKATGCTEHFVSGVVDYGLF